MRIALAQINPTIGALQANQQKIIKAIEKAAREKAELVIFPELALTGYPPEDLLLLPHFLDAATQALLPLVQASQEIAVVLGSIRQNDEGRLFNSAFFLANKQIAHVYDKQLLPTYDVFQEARYFTSGNTASCFLWKNQTIALTICEDLWSEEIKTYAKDPLLDIAKQKPNLLLNLSASPFQLGKGILREKIAQRAAKKVGCPLLLVNQVGGNDSLIFDGHSFAMNAQGELVSRAPGFSESITFVNTETCVPTALPPLDPEEELFSALKLGLADYCHKLGIHKVCLGLSGGIDSALVACIATEALGQGQVLAVTMPSRYSSPISLEDAHLLAQNLKIAWLELPIEAPFISYLDLLKELFAEYPVDVTEENLQARIRGTLLMALSNKLGYLLLNTGNKSELAMGYCTLYGDMCGGLSVISDLTKGQVYSLSRWINKKFGYIPERTLTRAPSAELAPNQKDSDHLPDYAILDTILTAYIEEGLSPKEIIKKFQLPPSLVQELIHRIHRNEYKRRQAPLGLRVSSKAFFVGRRFPIVHGYESK